MDLALISIAIAGGSLLLSSGSILVALRANGIAKEANKISGEAVAESKAQTKIAGESLVVAREARQLAENAQESADNAYLVGEFADADRSLTQWTIDTPEKEPWTVVVRERGSQQVRDLSIWLRLDDMRTLHRKLDHVPVEGVVFDVAEVAEEIRAERLGNVQGNQPVRIKVRCSIEWRGRSRKALTCELEQSFDYPRPVPRLHVF